MNGIATKIANFIKINIIVNLIMFVEMRLYPYPCCFKVKNNPSSKNISNSQSYKKVKNEK